jgi:SAM-dependent methyltransferase
MNIWENLVSLHSDKEWSGENLTPARSYLEQQNGEVQWDLHRFPLERSLDNDPSPIPKTEHREGYYGPNHFNYWASGLRDICQILEWTEKNGVNIKSSLDIGCATGRIVRHLKAQLNFDSVLGCDINRLHVEWVNSFLPGVAAFQNSSIPSLPLPDASVDFVSAFSLFTHIEAFETAWLFEIKRVLKPGGIAWITVHSDRIWRELQPDWPLYAGVGGHPLYAKIKAEHGDSLPSNRFVLRWHENTSYSSNVFYQQDYLFKVWSKIMPIVDFFPAIPHFQDVLVMRKPAS